MPKTSIRFVLTNGQGTGTGSATVEVYRGKTLVATVTAIIEPEYGSSGRLSPTVKLLTDAEEVKWQ